MGVASYWRGSRAISLQFQMDAYERDPSRPNPNAVPAPTVSRPADWGSKTAERARIEAEKIAAWNIKDPGCALDRAGAVYFVMERAKCGKSTAEEAVKRAGL